AVRETVHGGARDGRNLQRAAVRSLQGRIKPHAVRAVHSSARRKTGSRRTAIANGFPAGETRRREELSCSGGRESKSGDRSCVEAARAGRRREDGIAAARTEHPCPV